MLRVKKAHNLSIHDLTRRSTLEGMEKPIQRRKPFNSRPHKEVDGNIAAMACGTIVFQFTTSQGGRRIRNTPFLLPRLSFNSRPHKEVDSTRASTMRSTRTFNSRPHKEVDR